jgi:hypothetical protein
MAGCLCPVRMQKTSPAYGRDKMIWRRRPAPKPGISARPTFPLMSPSHIYLARCFVTLKSADPDQSFAVRPVRAMCSHNGKAYFNRTPKDCLPILASIPRSRPGGSAERLGCHAQPSATW